MSLANARGWSQVCEKQIRLLQEMRSTFPQRSDSLELLSHQWRDLQRQLDAGQVPRLPQ